LGQAWWPRLWEIKSMDLGRGISINGKVPARARTVTDRGKGSGVDDVLLGRGKHSRTVVSAHVLALSSRRRRSRRRSAPETPLSVSATPSNVFPIIVGILTIILQDDSHRLVRVSSGVWRCIMRMSVKSSSTAAGRRFLLPRYGSIFPLASRTIY
jgi:hypothetical protein